MECLKVTESGWKIEYEFAYFLQFLRILGLLSEASNPCLEHLNLLGIYRGVKIGQDFKRKYILSMKRIFH